MYELLLLSNSNDGDDRSVKSINAPNVVFRWGNHIEIVSIHDFDGVNSELADIIFYNPNLLACATCLREVK